MLLCPQLKFVLWIGSHFTNGVVENSVPRIFDSTRYSRNLRLVCDITPGFTALLGHGCATFNLGGNIPNFQNRLMHPEVRIMEKTKAEPKPENRQTYQAPQIQYQGQWETVVGWSRRGEEHGS